MIDNKDTSFSKIFIDTYKTLRRQVGQKIQATDDEERMRRQLLFYWKLDADVKAINQYKKKVHQKLEYLIRKTHK